MLVCRCCLTFEDNLFPFDEHKPAFQACTGINVERNALICPTCIRKLNEAFAFREQSLQSDEFLRNQQSGTSMDVGGEVLVKKEPLDYDEEKYDDHFGDLEPLVKVEEKPQITDMTAFFDSTEQLPFVNVMLPEPVRRSSSKKKGKKISRTLDTPEAVANSIRAKLAWSHGAKENLIKECPYCFLSGLKKIDLKRHIQTHIDQNGGYECDHCNKKYWKKKVLKGHLLRVYLGIKRSGPATLVCTSCEITFTKREELRAHFAELHPGMPVPEPTSAGPFICLECGKELSSKHCLQMHEMTHTGLRPFICPTCGHGYRTKDQLKTHELSHTGELPFLCQDCGKGFKSKSQMSAHVGKAHSGSTQARRLSKKQDVFACDFCGKEFKAKNLLKSHLISHDDAMNYACEICGMKFKRASNWRLHKSTHSEQRDFGCGDCGTAFKRRYALKRHMGQHAYKMGLHETSFELRKGSPNSGFKWEGFVMQGPPRYTNPEPIQL